MREEFLIYAIHLGEVIHARQEDVHLDHLAEV